MTADQLWPRVWWYEFHKQRRLANPGFWGDVVVTDYPYSLAVYTPKKRGKA